METETPIENDIDLGLLLAANDVRTEDGYLGDALYELRRAIASPWPEDLLPAVHAVAETVTAYRQAVKDLVLQIAKEDE